MVQNYGNLFRLPNIIRSIFQKKSSNSRQNDVLCSDYQPFVANKNY
nr:MAG TPA: hypothetical protein [Caudoviricetes sp.]